METAFSYVDEVGYISSDERRWINKIRKLHEEYPDQVIITTEPEKNDGCICAKMPAKWFKISPPRKVEMTDEERAQRAEQLRRNLKRDK